MRRSWRGVWVVLVVTGLTGCGESASIEPRAPDSLAQAQEPVTHPVPPGLIEAPIRLDLQSTVARLEAAIPLNMGNLERRSPVADNDRLHVAYRLRREPFTVGFRADTIRLSTTLHYRLRAWYNPPLLPEVSGSCGTGEAPEPRVRLMLGSVVRLDSSWRLRARTRLLRLEPMSDTERDRCTMSLIQFDMTGRVMTAAREMIGSRLREVDRELARVDVRTPLENVWREIQKPIYLTDSLWLVLQPEGVGVGRLQGDTSEVGTRLQLTTRPRIEAGARPSLPQSRLPPLGEAIGAEGFQIMVEGRFPYAALTKRLTARLTGSKLRMAAMRSEVRGVSVYPTDGGRLALGLDLRGSVGGRVYLVGTPALDPTGSMLRVPDLEFDPGTAGLLVRGLAWLGSRRIRDELRGRAQVSITDLLSSLSTLAERGMNRTLAPGVRLEAQISQARPEEIHLAADALVLHAIATGSAALRLDGALFRPKEPRN